MPLNITSSTSQPIATGNGNADDKSQENSGEFNSLLATLLSLTSATNGTSDTEANPFNTMDQATQTNIADINASLAGLTAQIEQTTGEENGNPHAKDLLANLTEALTGLMNAIEETGAVSSDQIESAHAAIEALTELLSHARQPLAPTANTATQTTPTEQIPEAGIASVASAGGKLPEALENIINRLIEQGPNGAHKLEALAERLSETRPNLSARIADLAQKLAEIAPQNAATPAPVAVAKPLPEQEVIDSLAALLGKDKAKGTSQPVAAAPKADDSVEIKLTQVEAGKTSDVDAKTSRPEPTTNTNTNNETKFEQRAPSALIAAQNAVTPTSAKAEVKPIDTLLLAQTGQFAAKPEFSGAVKPVSAAYQSPSQQLNMPHIAFEMVKQIRDGATRFQIRLNPPEMGRIDVKMEIDNSGALNARLTVERPETLDLLQRDSRALERALAQAGLDGNRTNLEFSLRQNPFARSDDQAGSGFGGNGDGQSADAEDNGADTGSNLENTYIYQGTASPGGVNMLA